ncbi:MAG: hypothetical protein WCH84_07225 [Verrucomicrobiota bacterium]
MNDFKLDQLLRQWRDVEPRGNFDECVRRRIRQAETIPARSGWLDWLRQPALAIVAAVVIGLTAGTIGGLQSAPHSSDELQFMAPTTLAGAYLNMEAK